MPPHRDLRLHSVTLRERFAQRASVFPEKSLTTTQANPSPLDEKPAEVGKPRRRHWLRHITIAFAVLVLIAIVIRAFLPSMIIRYVNRALDQSPLYDGTIDDVDLHIYRGAYTIRNVRLIKTTGNVPVPLFSCSQIDLAISWNGLRHGKVVGRVLITSPQVNFVDGPSETTGNKTDQGDSGDQTGAGGPWLQILSDLFPFDIDRVVVTDGSVHFRSYPAGDKPVDVYLSQLEATVDNLTNIQDDITPLITTVKASGMAMDSAKFEYQMKLDPFSYKPTFHMMTRLMNLDVTKLNDLTRTYGSFDFSQGWFDLVVELDSKEGLLRGYVKPLFRNLKIFTTDDIEEDHVFQVFWEALVGGAQQLLKNQNRDQFGTLIPFSGEVDGPKPSILDTIGNVLRNGFIRAYLPKLQNDEIVPERDGLKFDPPSLTDPISQFNESRSDSFN
jgi:hypothetical protein